MQDDRQRKVEFDHYTVIPTSNYGKLSLEYVLKYAPDERRAFAMEMICRWGLVAGDVDGEDSAGRSRQRRMSSEEIVEFACDVAARAFVQFEERGWMEKLPSLEELGEMALSNSALSGPGDEF